MTGNQSLSRGLQILDLFTESEPELGTREIGRMLQIDKSIASRLVSTLAEHAFLEQNPHSRRYRVGPRAFEIGQRYVRSSHLNQAAYDNLQELADRFQCNTYLGVRSGLAVVYLNVVQKSVGSVIRINPGFRGHLHSTAVGKVLLAALPDSELEQVLAHMKMPKLAPKTLGSRPKLLAEIRKIRRQGFSISCDENFSGIQAFGAPVRDASGRVIAALSAAVSGKSRQRQAEQELIHSTVATAEAISGKLGALPGSPLWRASEAKSRTLSPRRGLVRQRDEAS